MDIACSAEHAFHVWTTRIATWWPPEHRATAEAHTTVILEPRLGGRLLERMPSGREVQWGEITTWDPPRRLAYLWHIRRDRADATEVEIRFIPVGTDAAPPSRSCIRLGATRQPPAPTGATATSADGTASSPTSSGPPTRSHARFRRHLG